MKYKDKDKDKIKKYYNHLENSCFIYMNNTNYIIKIIIIEKNIYINIISYIINHSF